MAVQNHIYIYIGKNGAPTILNVDNAADGTALEQLGALKMPEAMASEVFGENIRYADNTTCTVTANPANSAFPYDVTFDASKIIKKPKRDKALLAQMAMPSEKYIDLGDPIQTNIAPADGYLMMGGIVHNVSSANVGISVRDFDNNLFNGYGAAVWGANGQGISVTLPIKKGRKFNMYHGSLYEIQSRFIYAEGAIEE